MEPINVAQNDQAHQDAEKELKQVFEKIPEQIPVYLFAQPGKNDVFSDTARKAIRYFKQLSNKIVFHEYDLSHKLAKKWNIDNSPTILIDPEHYNIRWLGHPLAKRAGFLLKY